jgi:hypothetical protein
VAAASHRRQAEALWIRFESRFFSSREAWYPFAIKVAAGKVNALNGEPWRAGLDFESQGYVVAPSQPWLDGFVVEKGVIRQFVAMPLGAGYSAEEQLTGQAEWGGLQIEVFPMKRSVFEQRFPKRRMRSAAFLSSRPIAEDASGAVFAAMALAPGGRMRQQIVADEYDRSDWDLTAGQRCFVHLANSMLWRAITGSEPPHPPVTAAEYTKAGLPWFAWYTEQPTLAGAKNLAGLSSVKELGEKNGQRLLFENESVDPAPVVAVEPAKRPPGKGVRVGSW